MSLLSRLFGARPTLNNAAREAHDRTVRQARTPEFFIAGAAEDTLEGRFDMVVLHAALVMRRLRREGEDGRDLSQALFDVLFSNLDHALRENGVGDTRIATRMRELGETFYGQARALDAALDGETPEADLMAFFSRNGPGRGAELDRALAAYALRLAAHLDRLEARELLAGRITFPAVDDLSAASAP